MSVVEEKEYLGELKGASYSPKLNYQKEYYPKIYPSIASITYLKTHPSNIYVKKLAIRRFRISLNNVLKLASSDWNTLKGTLSKRLAEQGYLKANQLAEVLAEEAKARARELVRKHFSKEYELLVDKVAKYILAFALAEEFITEEEDYTSI